MIVNYNTEKKFKNRLEKDVNLAKYSWFNLGGNAEYFFKAEDKDQQEFLKYARKHNLKIIRERF